MSLLNQNKIMQALSPARPHRRKASPAFYSFHRGNRLTRLQSNNGARGLTVTPIITSKGYKSAGKGYVLQVLSEESAVKAALKAKLTICLDAASRLERLGEPLLEGATGA